MNQRGILRDLGAGEKMGKGQRCLVRAVVWRRTVRGTKRFRCWVGQECQASFVEGREIGEEKERKGGTARCNSMMSTGHAIYICQEVTDDHHPSSLLASLPAIVALGIARALAPIVDKVRGDSLAHGWWPPPRLCSWPKSSPRRTRETPFETR